MMTIDEAYKPRPSMAGLTPQEVRESLVFQGNVSLTKITAFLIP